MDNSRSAGSSVRRLKARRTWTGSQEVRFEETTRKSVSGGVEVKAVLNLRGELEQAVRRSRTTVDVLLHWKRVWQEGNLIVTTSSGDVFEVPYREVVGLTFDQENRDR